MSEVTQILSAIEQGDPHAAAQLLPLVYDELRKLAAQRLAQEKPGQTLEATALVHEAYLRLVGGAEAASEQRWDSRGHFFAAAAEAMRRILVEQARRKRRQKHGGDRKRVELTDAPAPADDDRLLALDEALGQLAQEDPQAARVAELRQFAGLGHEEIAATLGITVYQAWQKWSYARAKYGWQSGNPEFWSAKAGILQADVPANAAQPAWLHSMPKLFGNFHFHADVQLEQGYGLIHFRTKPDVAHQGYRWHPEGSLYSAVTNDYLVKGNGDFLRKRWNRIEIIANGSHIVFKQDGQVILDFTDPDPGRHLAVGRLRFQVNPGSRVCFRKIEIKELPPEP